MTYLLSAAVTFRKHVTFTVNFDAIGCVTYTCRLGPCIPSSSPRVQKRTSYTTPLTRSGPIPTHPELR